MKSLAEHLGTAPQRADDESASQQQVSSKLNPNLLTDLLELKQVISKLKNDLLEPEQVSKQVIGFRLQLADDVQQVSPQQKGGQARAAKLSPARRREIALLGVAARRKIRDDAASG